MSSKSELTMIGWREFVALPEWGVDRIRAKIDTGARTSAVHVGEIEELDDGRIRFDVVVREKPKLKIVSVEADPVRESVVKPSSGQRQRRFVCRTPMRIGDVEHEIEVSLVCRKGMLCRMLVGRTALAGYFSVDPSEKYLVSKKRTGGTKKAR